MKRFLSFAALSCALPLHAVAQHTAPPADPPCRAEPQADAPASAALPPRAGTQPMPERGTVAPVNKLPSHVESASSRRMAAVNARQEVADAKKNPEPPCRPMAGQIAPVEDGKKS